MTPIIALKKPAVEIAHILKSILKTTNVNTGWDRNIKKSSQTC